MIDNFDERFDRAFALVAYTANRHILEHMRRITLELDMDFDSVFIWGTLAHLNVAPLLTPGSDPVLANGSVGDESGLKPVRLADLAQITGFPRETVRRKLLHLESRGKVEKTFDGRWRFALAGIDAKACAFTRESVLRLLKTADAVEEILARVPVKVRAKA